MNNIKYIAASVAAALTLGSVTGCRPHSTENNENGVQYCKFWCGSEKVEIVPPGQTVFLAPLRWDWYTLPITMQNFYMTRSEKTGDRKERDDLQFKTKEGNDIGQDVVMNWRLDQSPKCVQTVIETVGIDIDDIKEKYVRPLARSIVRDYLSQLSSSEFYMGDKRFKMVTGATEELKKRFAKYCILVDQVSLQEYVFDDPEYQKAIDEARGAAKDKEKWEKMIDSQAELWKKNLQDQVGASNQQEAAANGEDRRVRQEADSTYVENEKKAEYTLAQRKAEGEAIVKLREAMNSRGGDSAVLMAYIENFHPLGITVLPCGAQGGNGATIRRLDLNGIINADAVRPAQ